MGGETPHIQERWGSDFATNSDSLDVPGDVSLNSPITSEVELEADPSLLELPDSIRDKAIKTFLFRRSRPPLPSRPTLDKYSPCSKSS